MLGISNLTARKLALSQQGLLSAKPKFGRGKKAALKAIEHLGYVQIDAISVIQRAHHHTLWSRVPGYKPKHLNVLLSKDRSIFEYWSHAAAFLPMKDYPFALPVMQTLSTKAKHWYQVDPDFKSQVLERIRNEGPLYARDFETPEPIVAGMWSWKPAKKALHELFMEGSIAVKSRDSFHRLYDIPERVIPIIQAQPQPQPQPQSQAQAQAQAQFQFQEQVPIQVPSIRDYIWHRCKQAMWAHGVVTIPEIRYQREITSDQVVSVLQDKESQGLAVPLRIDGSSRNYYSLPEILESYPGRVVKQLHFLSPFDNAVIQRKRVKELFHFDYQTEIYYPVDKRKYGYFSLPILYGTDFIGRLDPKAHRDQKVLEIRNLALESGVKITEKLLYEFKLRLHDFTVFNECDQFSISKSTPDFLKSALS